MANGDPYDYARSPVEIGLSAALGAARDSYMQRAEYEKTKAEMRMKREIRNAEMLHQQASLAVSQGQLAETRRYHDVVAGKAEETAREREKTNRIREALRREQIAKSPNQLERERLAAIRTGPGYAAEAGRQERFKLTRVWDPDLGAMVLPPEETVSEGFSAGLPFSRSTIRRPRKGGKKTVADFMPPK